MSAEVMEVEMGVKERDVSVRADSEEDEEASEFEVELTDDSGESMDSDAALEKVTLILVLIYFLLLNICFVDPYSKFLNLNRLLNLLFTGARQSGE